MTIRMIGDDNNDDGGGGGRMMRVLMLLLMMIVMMVMVIMTVVVFVVVDMKKVLDCWLVLSCSETPCKLLGLTFVFQNGATSLHSEHHPHPDADKSFVPQKELSCSHRAFTVLLTGLFGRRFVPSHQNTGIASDDKWVPLLPVWKLGLSGGGPERSCSCCSTRRWTIGIYHHCWRHVLHSDAGVVWGLSGVARNHHSSCPFLSTGDFPSSLPLLTRRRSGETTNRRCEKATSDKPRLGTD